MMVSMRDVARRANVSVGTVSKCLNGVPTIPEETRRAVVAIAQEMGYQTHPYVSALMRTRRKKSQIEQQQPSLAYVTAFPTSDGWQKVRFFKSLFDGARTRADARGYALSHYWLYRDGMTNSRFSEVLRVRGVRGLLFNPVPKVGFHCELKWKNFSVVTHGLSITNPEFHRTSNDHYQSMLLAMKQCRLHGYTRPGFALEAQISERLEYRWEGAYMVARDKLGFDRTVPPLLLQRSWNAEDLCRWVRTEKPDVVITLMLEEQLADLQRAGLRVPDEVGIISLSVEQRGSPLSGIFQDPYHMGEIAVDKLIELVERNETGVPGTPITLNMDGEWNDGATLRLSAPTGENLTALV